ncbi:hypothetical protein [Paraflavitalea speifideaquila]|uniref:hypothetical protein n=1 Tax=Paraflavitalea speifideaquila TaxID=3076558 RepID=UPI0028E64458|nr:hypothetical protein [Paraflavitalea speifideiaquila]
MPFDIGSSQAGPGTTISVSSGNVPAGQLAACGTSLTEVINYTLNGISYNYNGLADSLSAIRYDQNQETDISGSRPNGNANIRFSFTGAAPTGSKPMYYLTVWNNGKYYIMAGSPSVNVTEFGAPVNGFIAGNFRGNVKDSATAAQFPIYCTFRVRRSN